MSKVCSLCREKLPTLESCTCKSVLYMGEPVSRIQFGEEEYDWGTARCASCGVPRGPFTMKTVVRRFVLCAVS